MREFFPLAIFLLLALSAFAQFDHVADQGSPLNLGLTVTDSNGLHREFTSTVTNQFVVGGQCRQTVHSVTNVQLNNGPLNSGTYFSLTLTRTTSNGTLSVSFGSPDGPYYTILQAVGGTVSSDTIGVCAVTSCTFRYYCSIYAPESPLEVIVDSDCNLGTNSINFYDLSVTQNIETIQIVPASRSLTQSSPVVNPFNTNNLGPANFVHYYHDLQPSVAEAGRSSRLYIEAVNWSTSTSGTAYICVSYDRMVASTSSLSQVSPFSGNVDTAPITVSTISEPSGCPVTCAAGTITGSGSVILAVPACNNGCGFRETIWIGVRAPSTSVGSTYTVRLRFRDFSVPDLVSINSTPAISDGALVDTCNGEEGNFGCDDYYEITYASVGSPVVSDRRVGPFLAVELFGVYNGVARLEVADGFLAGKASLCAGCTPFSTCTVCEDPASRPTSQCTRTDCWSVVQPCQWNSNLSNDWVFTVSAVSQDDLNIPIEYGVRASIGSWPLTTVTPTAWETGQPNFGKVLVDYYSHYQVTFTDAQIFDDSYFEVELYTNYDDDRVGFAWNFNTLADDGTCYGSAGRCTTNTNCADGTVGIGSCRFAFVKCPISFSYQDYFSGDAQSGQVSGSKFSELQAGTYYFAVWGVQPGSLSYNNAIEYSIYWNYHRALPVYDQVTYNNFIYNGDYSPQYKLIVPDDDNIYQIRFRISDTQKGGITAYVNCGELAGSCPCWTFDDSCSTNSATDSYDCDLVLDRCQCDSGPIYLTVRALSSAGTILQGLYTKPITYSVTPYLVRFSDFTQRTVIHPISASRAISPIIGTISDPLDALYNLANNVVAERDNIRVYRVSLNNVGITDEDAMLVTLRITPQELWGLDTSVSVSSPTSPSMRVSVLRNSLCSIIDSCDVQANSLTGSPPTANAGLNSHCTITLQPCFVDVNECVTSGCQTQRSDRSFSSSSTYFIALENLGTPASFLSSNSYPDSSFIEGIQYTLNVQIVDQSAYELNNGIPFFGDVARNNYVHFSFDVAEAPANNRLVFSLYGDHDQRYPLTFFINYDSKAGKTSDCYAQSNPCYICSLYEDAAATGSAQSGEVDHCYYEITPCELSRRTGTYFVSVFGNLQTDNDQALFTVQANYFPTVALLDATGFGVPTPGNVRQRSSAYYSVTVPTLVNGNIVGRILSIDVEAVINGQIYVTITQITPDNQCDCAKDGHIVTASIAGSRDDINWKRYNCELTSGEVYYISIEADQNLYCDPTGFVVHAKLQNIISVPITLTSVDSRIIGSFDSNNTSSGLVLEYNQFTALTFTTNAPPGAVLNIVITEASSLFNDVLPFDVFLSIGSVYTPSGTNDDTPGLSLGPMPDTERCPVRITNCRFAGTANEQCQLFVDACQVPQGSVTWFLTFSGELLPLNRQSEVINVAIRLIASEPIVNTPAISSYGAVQTTGLQFDNTINRSFGRSYFTTSAALGINAGDRLTFGLSVTADLYVSYQTETNVDGTCQFTCSASGGSPQCTVYACEAISAGTWFFAIKPSSPSTTATLTITRTQVENSTLSIASPSPLPLNTDTTFTSLGANEWRYHSFTVSASTSSHYELLVSGGASSSNIVYVSSPIWLPYLTVRSLTNNDVTLVNSGVTARTCGGFTSPLPEETCCYDATTVTFAVIGSVGGYTLQVRLVEFAGNQVQSVSVPSNTTGTATLGRVNWYSFTQPADTHLWFDFAVFTGAADLYLNGGSRAGSRANNFENGGDFGFCWGNDGLVGNNLCSTTVSAGSFCDGFIAKCNPCLGVNNGYTFFFAVVPAPNATFSLQVITQSDRSIALGQNNALRFPVLAGSLDLLDLRSSTDSFSAYAHYFYTYSRSFNSIQNFIPVRNDPAVGDRFDYANLEIYIDNFRDSTGAVSNTIPLRFYINYNSLAGSTSSSGCYGGRDITTGGNVLPCIENTGAAFSNNTAIQCSINVCDLGNCGGEVYLSSGRLNSGSTTSFTYDIEILEDFNAVTEWVDIVNLQSNSFPFTYNGDNSTDVVYIRYTAPNFNNFADSSSQYVLFSLTNVTGASGAATTASFRFYDADTCSQLEDSSPVCPSIGSNGVCQLLTDPCGSGDFFDKNDVSFIRISRDSSDTGAWSFIFNAEILTVTPIDTTITTLSPALTTTSRTSYAATKEILDFTWHFYEFFVTPSDGYSWLSVDVNELCCTASGSNLEIFYSWEEQSDFEVFDTARPNRWASRSCNVGRDNQDTNSNDISDLCNFWAGAYRIGIFAPRGHQLFPNTVLGEVYPALYFIGVQVNTVPHGTASLECTTSQIVDASNFVMRWEVYVPAENRGSELTFTASLDVPSSGDDLVMWVSKNSNPWTRVGTSSNCIWDTTFDGDYNCSPSGSDDSSCNIVVPPCQFEDGTWFLFLQRRNTANIAGATVSFMASLGAKKYIPTLDVRTTDVVMTSGLVYNSLYQYYRVLVNPADELSLLTAQIMNTGCVGTCTFRMYISVGPRGFASINSGSGFEGPACVDDGNCSPSCFCSDANAGSVVQWNTCANSDVTSYFLGVTTSNVLASCEYDLKVWGRPRAYADLPFNVETCSIASCIEYWGITDATGNTDLTDATVTINIINTGSTDISVYKNIGSVGPACGDENVCIAGASCVYVFDCIVGRLYIGITTGDLQCTGCGGSEYSITTTSVTYATFSTLVLGTAGTAGPATFTTGTQFVVANSNTPYSIGTYSSSGCGSACLRVLDLNSQYFFPSAAGLILSDVGNIVSVSTTAQSFTLSEPYFHFQITPPAGVESFTLFFDNVAYCACDGGSIGTLGLYLRSSIASPPFDGCYDCVGGTQLVAGSCPSSAAPISFSCIAEQTYYFTISSCQSHTCDITFTAYVEFSVPRTLIGGDHTAAFTAVSATNVNCGGRSPSGFYVEVTDILSVSLKEPHGDISGATVTVTPQGNGCSSPFVCSVVSDSPGYSSSCRAAACDVYSFANPGTYYVDVSNPLSASGDSSVVYVQVVNSWVDLSGSVSSSIIGQTRHFYRLSNAASAISIDLTISEGPSLNMIVFDGLVSPGSDLRAGFQETVVCSFGTCSVYIPSFAKHSLSDTFYIEIDSASISADNNELTRAKNNNAEKPTRYTLSATLGTANCAAPPATGFCASNEEGGNVWSEINNSVWNYERPDLKDAEAECRFLSLVDGCPNPSVECRRWLKVLSCLESFPQCDGSGFQMGICQDVCFEVSKVCGGFVRPEFNCCSDKYVAGNDSTISTCYNIPPPPPPPETFSPEPGSDISSVPPAFVVPIFDTIQVFLPDDFVRDNKDAVHVENVSAGSVITVYSVVILCLVAIFF